MIAIAKHFWPHVRSVKKGEWKRVTGSELYGKTIAILGMGRIGKEVAKRARAFEMNVKGYDLYWDDGFAQACSVQRCTTAEDALKDVDFVSLHMNLDENNRGFINKTRIAAMKKGAVIINTARGGLVNEEDVAEACRSGQLGGYAADVLEHEPIKAPHPFMDVDNIVITPHVGSRTFESVERQAMRATLNIVNYLNGEKDYIQANQF
jgi:D-3-phosphoglycerate dehydrogenase